MSAKRPAFGAAVFENLPTAALIVDGERRVLAINKEARRATGSGLGAIGRRTCAEVCGCRAAPSACPLARAWRTDEPVHRAEVPVWTRTGSGRMIERIAPYYDPETGRRRAIILFGGATRYFKRIRRLRYQARTDHLTRISNRRHFEDALSRLVRVERRSRPCAFLMLDVDGLKAVNDRLGHAAGDRLLARLGSVLRRHTRAHDLVGRLGGDEFGIYCPATSCAQARELARRLRAAAAADNALHPDQPRLSFTLGLACRGRGSFGDLRAEADARLRSAKPRRGVPIWKP